ncbi:hypothetical protein [Treponema zioleckii]|uniref:hypothetical protein n=1 Tax=Treponema zioleckii TaxID=331680 RepID=UPI00168A4D69|nr:hypothetical protein [Treponema zioleckii]
MKAPLNFNTGATKKDPLADAISGNFKREETSQPAAAVETPKKVSATSAQTTQNSKELPKDNVKDTKERFIITMAKGERALFKSFCALKQVSMNHFVICAMDYFKEEVENGNVVLTPHGYKRQSN